MIGKSWGGFNGLQIAAHKPPELKEVEEYGPDNLVEKLLTPTA